jgi:UDP-glucuronate 4-epimerase
MQSSILVTGAAGFIGSALTERLLAAGARVTGLDNFDPFYDPDEKRQNLATAEKEPDFEFVEVDCADYSALERKLEGSTFEVIVHLAGKAGVRPSIEAPLDYLRANVLATQTMLEFARRREIDRFVFGSSSSVYGNNAKVPFAEDDPVDHPISPYAATKRSCELIGHTYHHLYGMTVLCLRFFTVYGPRQRPDLAIRKFASLMMRGEPIPMFGPGDSERDYTWIDDIIDGLTAAIDRSALPGSQYELINLGGHRTTPLRRLIHLLADSLGVEPHIRELPVQPGDVRRTYADIDKARRLLGYEPEVDIEHGIPRFVEWLATHPERINS